MRRTISLYENDFSYHPFAKIIYDPVKFYEKTCKNLHKSLIIEHEDLLQNKNVNRDNYYIEKYITTIDESLKISEYYNLRDILIEELDKIDEINKDKRTEQSVRYKRFILSRLTYHGLDKNVRDIRIVADFDEARILIFSRTGDTCEK